MKAIRKLLIKDYDKVEKTEVRTRYGIVAGIIGIVSNAILFAFKLLVGILGGSITIVADAINNLSDAGSSVVTLIGFRLASKPADKEHPFGHARYEYITALIVALIILVIGVLLCKSSIEKIITPEETVVTVYTYVVLAAAIVMKVLQMFVYRDFSNAINSQALRASSDDSRNDVLATTLVLVSAIVIDTTGVNIDGYMGAVVSLFIIISALMLVKDTINPLIGEKPDSEFVRKLKDEIMSYDGILGMHDLMVHSYGVNASFAICHVEVDSAVPIMQSHDLIDTIEREVHEKLGVTLNIHLDPIDIHDEEIPVLKERAEAILGELDKELSIHDFRIVRGISFVNVVFDVVIPYDSKVTLAEVEKALDAGFNVEGAPDKYYFVVSMDR